MSWLLYLVLFFVMQSAVLLCCLAAGNDPSLTDDFRYGTD